MNTNRSLPASTPNQGGDGGTAPKTTPEGSGPRDVNDRAHYRATLEAIVKRAEFCGYRAGPTATREAMLEMRWIAEKALCDATGSAT